MVKHPSTMDDEFLTYDDEQANAMATDPPETGEVRDEPREEGPTEVVEEALQKIGQILVPSKKEADLVDTDWFKIEDQLERLEGMHLGLHAKKTLMDLANARPRFSAMVNSFLGFNPSRRCLYTPGLFWGCLKHKRPFLEMTWKVVLFVLLLFISKSYASDCDSETNTTYNDGLATMHTSVVNYKTQLYTEQIDLKPLYDLENNLESRINSVELSKMDFNDSPLQCGSSPVTPTDLLTIGRILFDNNQFSGVFVAPLKCNPRYSVLASMKPIGRYARKEIAASNSSRPIFCSYFPTPLQQVQMLASNDRSTYIQELGNGNPLDVYVTLLKTHLVNPDNNEQCVFLGDMDKTAADKVVIGKDFGIYECLELCYSVRHGTDDNYGCEAASYDIIHSTCYLFKQYDKDAVDYLLDYGPVDSDLHNGYYTINWIGTCLSDEINYLRPTIAVGDTMYNVIDICEYVVPDDRIDLRKDMLGKITDGAKGMATEMLSHLRNLTRAINSKYSVSERFERSAENIDWMAGLNTGKSVYQTIKQISEITKMGINTWKSFNSVEDRPGFNNANMLQRVSSNLKTRGQSSNIFKFDENKMHRATNQLELFANQYANLLNGTVAKVDIKTLFADFLKIKAWVLKLLKNPIPLTVKLNNTRDYLYSPAVIRQNMKNILYRRFMRIEPESKDMNNLLLASFPVSPSTYKEENFRSSFGPVTNWKKCLLGNEETCKVVKGKTVNEITTLSHGDKFDSTIVAINRDEFQLIVMCNHQKAYFKKHFGYTVTSIPPNCKLVIDNETVVESQKGNHSPCNFEILFADGSTYPKANPPTAMEMLRDTVESSKKAFIISIAGIILALFVYFRFFYLWQRRHDIPNVVLTKVKKIYQKDDQSVMEVSRPITDGEETEHIYSEVSVRASPKTGREYKV